MSVAPDPESLKRLEARIDAVKKSQEPEPKQETSITQAHHAWRMMIDLIVGTGLGAAIGYGLDVLFGTMPWILVVFTLLGFAAGVNLMLKTAKELEK